MSKEHEIQALVNLSAMLKRKDYLDKAILENQERQKVTPSFVPLFKEDKLPTNQADTYLRQQLDILCRKKLFVTSKVRYKLEDSVRNSREFQNLVEQDHRNIAENRSREKKKREDYEKGILERKAKLKEELKLHIQERESLTYQIENNKVLHPNDFSKLERILEKMNSYRADTIKEALQQCDAEDLKFLEMKAENDWRIAQQKKIAEEEAKRLWEQRVHQKNVERELEKQTKAIEDAFKR